MRQLVWKQGNHAIPPGSPGFDPRHCKLSGVCCEGGCARPCPGWRFTRLSPIIQHPAGLWRCPEVWPASRSQIVAASVERSDTMCTDTQSRVLLPSEKKKKKKKEKRGKPPANQPHSQDKDKAAEPEAQPDHHRTRERGEGGGGKRTRNPPPSPEHSPQPPAQRHNTQGQKPAPTPGNCPDIPLPNRAHQG